MVVEACLYPCWNRLAEQLLPDHRAGVLPVGMIAVAIDEITTAAGTGRHRNWPVPAGNRASAVPDVISGHPLPRDHPAPADGGQQIPPATDASGEHQAKQWIVRNGSDE